MYRTLLNVSLIVFLILLNAGHILSQENSGPRIFVEERIFQAKDVVSAGSRFEHTFRVLNKGDSPLNIDKVDPG